MPDETDNPALLQRIAELEAENLRLREGLFCPSGGERTVFVPDDLRPQFDRAERTVHDYFQQVIADPARGWIEIAGQRYVLVRASALSIDFLTTVRALYTERGEQEADAIGRRLLFDVAHAIGINDARRFHRAMKLTDPISKLSAGPVHFAYTGWATVRIDPASRPAPDETYLLIYDHPYSFEASSWLRAGQPAERPVCIMNAGYSSGWCEESFGVPLVAVELSCRARGDPECHFIMAPPSRIEQRIAEHAADAPGGVEPAALEIPEFFESKRLEEELRRTQRELERRVTLRTAELSRTNEVLRREIGERAELEVKLREVAKTNRALASKVMEAPEEERKRVSRELHDSIGQVLAALKMDAEWIAGHASSVGDVRALADRLCGRLSETMATVRSVVQDLRPPLLDDLGVSSALEACVSDLARRYPLRCETRIGAAGGDLPPEMATAVYRIAQEALSNVVRHAEARSARISFEDNGREVVLSVADDGRGITDPASPPSSSMGLVSMQERAALLGGTVTIDSRTGHGTTVTARIPYHREADSA
jgi:signal transduction histidine kinase